MNTDTPKYYIKIYYTSTYEKLSDISSTLEVKQTITPTQLKLIND